MTKHQILAALKVKSLKIVFGHCVRKVRFIFLLFILIFLSHQSAVGQDKNTKTQLEYCVYQNQLLEKQVETYKTVLESQYQELSKLKNIVISIENDEEKRYLDSRIKELEIASIKLMDVANDLIEDKQYDEARSLLTIIKNTYPGTLEAKMAYDKLKALKGLKEK